MAFAFIISRHGSRAPSLHWPVAHNVYNEEMFDVTEKMLSPVGMRQRYLKGRYNKARYSSLLTPEFTPGQIYMQSSPTDRTRQSAAAEMMGFYPPEVGSIVQELSDEAKEAETSLPFVVRDEAKLLAELDGKPLPHDFIPIPVMNFEEGSVNDFRLETCPNFQKELVGYLHSKTYYDELYPELIDELREPVQAALGISDEKIASVGYGAMFQYSTIIVYKKTEGQLTYEFTEEQWQKLLSLQSIFFSIDLGEKNALYGSKVLDQPLAALNYKVLRMLDSTEEVSKLDQIKLFMYDGHESVFVLLFGWLKPTNFDNSVYKKYAS